MSDIVWEDPPPRTGGPGPSARHTALRANPGRWMIWHESTTAEAARWLASTLKATHGYDTCARGRKVYARAVTR